MIKPGSDFDFGEEPLSAKDCAEFRAKYFERDLTLQFDIFSEVHGGHATLTDLALNAVAVGQDRI